MPVSKRIGSWFSGDELNEVRRLLFLVRRAPYGGLQAQESLDLILSVAAFDQQVGLLFLDDGVLQLQAGQRPPQPGPRNLGAQLGLLETYGVQQVWVEQESLAERGMTADRLALPVDDIPRVAVPGLMAGFDFVISC
jgi:tRNA 2-thiouridine synthesizing protein C